MSIPVLASSAAATKAPSGGAAGGSAVSSGSAPAGAFAAVLQGSIDTREPSSPAKEAAAGGETATHTVDGVDQIVVPALFTQTAHPTDWAVTLMNQVGVDGVADATLIAPAGAVSTAAIAAAAPPAPPAGSPTESAGPGGVLPVPSASNEGGLITHSTPSPTLTAAAKAAVPVQGSTVTTADGSMTRTGERDARLTRSNPNPDPDATAATAGAAPDAAGSHGAAAAAGAASQPILPATVGREVSAATAATVAAVSGPVPTPARAAAAVDVVAAAASVPASPAAEPAASGTPTAAQPTMPPGLVPVQHVAPVAPAAPAASVAPAQPVPLAPQVTAPLFTLIGAKPGEHVLTINVTPDNLGPVTVRAHVSVDSVRVELFAPNDAGRDALRAIMPDLRRDLAGSGLNANLDLSSQNQAPDAEAARRDAQRERRSIASDPTADQPTDARPRTFGSSSIIDVLA